MKVTTLLYCILQIIGSEGSSYNCYRCFDCDFVNKSTDVCDTEHGCLIAIGNIDSMPGFAQPIEKVVTVRTCLEDTFKGGKDALEECHWAAKAGFGKSCHDCYTNLCNGAQLDYPRIAESNTTKDIVHPFNELLENMQLSKRDTGTANRYKRTFPLVMSAVVIINYV